MPSRIPMPPRTFSSGSFAESFENARHKLDEQDLTHELRFEEGIEEPESDDSAATPTSPASLASPATPPTLATPLTPAFDSVADDFAFAFDIDGVLVRGGKPIPEAIEAMKMLNGDNEYGVKVPYIFLTNGGGKTEEERCADLSGQLELEISPGQFICGHTPMRELAQRYTGHVLVVGGEGEKCRQVAEGYGFQHVITPGDIIKANAATTPFRKLTETEHSNSREFSTPLSEVVIEAVFVFADSRDWAGDMQIMLDVAMSVGGRLETRSETFEEGPPIYFSHNDVIWSAAHEHARLGMGALRLNMETMFSQLTGGKQLNVHSFGKPQVSVFEFATRLLTQWRRDQHGLNKPPGTVYFVGDTPESDIRGTNAMDESAEEDWYSILVKTGVYQDGTVPTYKPKFTVDTVLDAVRHGIEREMTRKQQQLDAEQAAMGMLGKSVQTSDVQIMVDETA